MRITITLLLAVIFFQVAAAESPKIETLDVPTLKTGEVTLCTSTTATTPASEEGWITFFANIFSSEGFPARWSCGEWSEVHGWLYIISDLLTWLAYFTIPVLLFLLIRRSKSQIPFKRTFIFFTLFIFFCGLTHLLDAIIFWEPLYRLSAVMRFLTAGISITTVFVFAAAFPTALKLKSPLQLEQEVQLRTKEVQERNKELNNVNRMMSHDLKAPLSNVSGLLHIIREDDLSKEERDELFYHMEASLSKSFEIIDQLRELTMEEGRRGLMADFQLESEVRELFEIIKFESGHQDARMEVGLNVERFAISGVELRSILQNLLTNSFKYRDKNRDLLVRLKTFEQGDEVVISYTDNGQGLDTKGSGAGLFELSSRFHEGVEGTGVGLYLVREIVGKYGGTISADGKVGQGLTFELRFPRE
jgi:signal transduction histidine kinase